MTPRNENFPLADLLIQQMHSKLNEFDLRQNEKVVNLLPPMVLKAKMGTGEPISSEIMGYQVNCFPNSAEAQSFSSLTPQKGTTAALCLFLEQNTEEALFDFAPFGFCFIFRKKSSPQNSDNDSFALFSWSHYALSPEVWGPQGNWVRFHQRLHTLFSEKKLLQGPDYRSLPTEKDHQEF